MGLVGGNQTTDGIKTGERQGMNFWRVLEFCNRGQYSQQPCGCWVIERKGLMAMWAHLQLQLLVSEANSKNILRKKRQFSGGQK